MPTLLLLIYTIITSAGLIFLKLGSQNGAPIYFEDGKTYFNFGLYVIIGIVLYGLSFILYTYLIARNDLGYIIPVSTALVYVFIFTASFIIFKEAYTALKIVGICLIISGVILLNLNR